MGQDISMIFTKEECKVNETIVHFYENDYLIIPLTFRSCYIESIIDVLIKYDTFDSFLLEESGNESFGLQEVIEIIKKTQLKTFVLLGYSEWGDVPVDHFEFIIQDRNIIKESIRLIDHNDNYYVETLLDYSMDEPRFNLDHYRDYHDCKIIYDKQKMQS